MTLALTWLGYGLAFITLALARSLTASPRLPSLPSLTLALRYPYPYPYP